MFGIGPLAIGLESIFFFEKINCYIKKNLEGLVASFSPHPSTLNHGSNLDTFCENWPTQGMETSVPH